MFAHAGHCRLCREEEGFFTKRIIRSLLRNQFKLCLCISKILALVIKLSQLHSNFRSERRGSMLLEEALGGLNNFRFVAAGCLLNLEVEVVAAVRSCRRLRPGCAMQVLARFVQEGRL